MIGFRKLKRNNLNYLEASIGSADVMFGLKGDSFSMLNTAFEFILEFWNFFQIGPGRHKSIDCMVFREAVDAPPSSQVFGHFVFR